MRLRLDKLVLSAGLALAMVATTIPVGAATTVTKSGVETSFKSDGNDFANQVTGISTATTDVKVMTDVTKSEALGEVSTYTPSEEKATITSDSKLTDYLGLEVGTNLDGSILNVVKPGVITVTQKTTYKATATDTVLEADDDTTTGAKALARAKAAADALLVKALPDDIAEADAVSTTGGKKFGSAGNKEDKGNADWETKEEGTYAAGDTVTVVRECVYTTTYKIDNIAPFGYSITYTVDSLSKTDTTTGLNNSYKVVKYTDSLVFSDVDSKLVDTTLSYDVTDLNSTYFIYRTTVSTADNLEIVKPTTTGYTPSAIQKEATEVNTTVKSLFKQAMGTTYDLVSYLDIDVIDNTTGKTVEDGKATFTFKFGVPAEIGTDGVVYKLLRIHGDATEPEILDTTISEDGKYIVVTLDRFSDYALVYTTSAAETPAETPAEDPTAEAPANEDTQAAPTATEAAQGSGTTSATGVKAGDNSMMPLFMTTLLLALCAGSLAIYKEKKTY